MKNKKQAEKKISLEKLQMVRISNAKIIKGGYAGVGGYNLNTDLEGEGEPTGTGKTR
ncbi:MULTISPECIES: hypothetical protein [Chryseobacterium]|uniref:hypothetical protein n=1 Tax=Chryseobacterium TaxID=59732 RepID=UPI000F90BDB0|nr:MULTISPECIES: hypothetical protein [Chryseobacterium]MCS4305369.1 hypothetical protein [Chryseobacterium sp. BIGb0232]ROS07580.1 hypothetical protein EDF65_4969 [Chryseobacterium nakagawai]